MRAITTRRELIALWLRMRRSLARFSGSDGLCRLPWSAGCIINTSESKFSVHTKHIYYCLQRTSGPDNKDAERIREGVSARNGKMVFAGAESCARDLGKGRQWEKGTRGC